MSPARPSGDRRTASPLDDASEPQRERTRGQTDYRTRLGSEGEVETASYWQLLFRRDRLRDNPASSARFSWVRRRCRNRSSPCRTAPVEAGSASRCRTLWSFQSRANPKAARPYRLQHTRGHCHSSAIVHAPVTHGGAVARSVPTWELPRPTPALRAPVRTPRRPQRPAARERRMFERVDPFIGTDVTDLPPTDGLAARGGGPSRRSATPTRARRRRSAWSAACAYSGAYPTGYGNTNEHGGRPAHAVRRQPWRPGSRTSSSPAPARSASTTTTSASPRCSSRSTPSTPMGPPRRGAPSPGYYAAHARLGHPLRAHRRTEVRGAPLHVPGATGRPARRRLLARRPGIPHGAHGADAGPAAASARGSPRARSSSRACRSPCTSSATPRAGARCSGTTAG